MAATMPRGRIVWCDCMTPDPAKTEAFYTRLIGWTITPMPMGDSAYRMWTVAGNTIGGIGPMPAEAVTAGATSHWLMYVSTPDVAATVAEAREMGASVMVKPTDIPTVGSFAVLRDPRGAMFAVFCALDAASRPPDSGAAPGVGEFSWFELATVDVAKDFGFYQKLFGWEKRDAHDMGEAGPYQLWGRPGQAFPTGGAFNKPAGMPACTWTLYISVGDMDTSCADVPKLGGKVVSGPIDVPGGFRVAQCTDPNGAAFALHWAPKD